jgi:hypothetical protein
MQPGGVNKKKILNRFSASKSGMYMINKNCPLFIEQDVIWHELSKGLIV